MVGASGFEPPASWSRTRDQRHVYHLQAVTSIAKRCAMLLLIKDFRGRCNRVLAKVRNASMQGVGTKLGTVKTRRTRAACL
jgi:hypothetical protein